MMPMRSDLFLPILTSSPTRRSPPGCLRGAEQAGCMITHGAEIDWDRPGRFPTIGRMPSYEPVDLSAACNAGVEVLGDEPGDVPLGRVDLRGLPFLIGSEPPAERCLLLPDAPTPVGIGRLALEERGRRW
jgi:hypothetical protein